MSCSQQRPGTAIYKSGVNIEPRGLGSSQQSHGLAIRRTWIIQRSTVCVCHSLYRCCAHAVDKTAAGRVWKSCFTSCVNTHKFRFADTPRHNNECTYSYSVVKVVGQSNTSLQVTNLSVKVYIVRASLPNSYHGRCQGLSPLLDANIYFYLMI